MNTFFRAKLKNEDGWVIGKEIKLAGQFYEIGGCEVIQESISQNVRTKNHPSDSGYGHLFEGDVIEDLGTGERMLVKWNSEKCGVEPFVDGYKSKYKRIGIYFTNPTLLDKNCP